MEPEKGSSYIEGYIGVRQWGQSAGDAGVCKLLDTSDVKGLNQ